MAMRASEVTFLRDPRLVGHATRCHPTRPWSPDGTHILRANAVGAAMFEAANAEELRGRA
jgi:hypothetical protein